MSEANFARRSQLCSGVLLAVILIGCNTTERIHYADDDPSGNLGLVRTTVNSYEIPFQYSPMNSAIIVNLKLNGTTAYPFILDTGAGQCFVDWGLIKKLALQPWPQDATITDAAGSWGKLRLYSAASVRLSGGAEGTAAEPELRNVPLIATNMDAFSGGLGMKVYGVLGMSLLKPFKFTIDNSRKVLFLRVDNTPEPMDSHHFHFSETQPNAICVPLTINGKIYSAQIDTGDLGPALSLPDSCIADTGVSKSDDCELDPEIATSQAALGSFTTNHLVRVRHVQIGPFRVSSLLAVTSKAALPLLGQDFLRHFNITVDFYNETVSLELNSDQRIQNNAPSFGFDFKKEKEGLRVTWLLPQFQYRLQGLEKGDLITKVDGVSGQDAFTKLVQASIDPNVHQIKVSSDNGQIQTSRVINKGFIFPIGNNELPFANIELTDQIVASPKSTL